MKYRIALTLNLYLGVGLAAAQGAPSYDLSTRLAQAPSVVPPAAPSAGAPAVVPPVKPPVAPSGPAKLLQQSDIVYQGAFRLPSADPVGTKYGFGYSQTGFAFNPAHNSLFVNNHQYDQKTAEITIPTPGTDVSNFPRSTYLQNFKDLTEGHLMNIGAKGAVCCTNGDWMGGLMVYKDKIIGSVRSFYDAGLEAKSSHFTNSTDLSSASAGQFKGMFTVGNLNPGFYAGWMANIPPEWQTALGGPAITGQCCISIISRTSLGPAAFVFNPDDLGVKNPAPATPLVYYPMDHATLGGWQDTVVSPLFNMTTKIGGVAFPAGSRTVLFVGRTEVGLPCYGVMTKDPNQHRKDAGNTQHYCYDPTGEEYTGPHCHECTLFVWAYDVNDLIAVKNGKKKPWEIKPYLSWPLSLLPEFEPSIAYEIQGVAYDPATQRLFISQGYADKALPGGNIYNLAPVIHVFKVTL